ncbi:uncharacterized protein V6R79_016339 [Siganus canaliculatus]
MADRSQQLSVQVHFPTHAQPRCRFSTHKALCKNSGNAFLANSNELSGNLTREPPQFHRIPASVEDSSIQIPLVRTVAELQ